MWRLLEGGVHERETFKRGNTLISTANLFHNLGPIGYEIAFRPWVLLLYGDCSLYADLRVLCPWLNGW